MYAPPRRARIPAPCTHPWRLHAPPRRARIPAGARTPLSVASPRPALREPRPALPGFSQTSRCALTVRLIPRREDKSCFQNQRERRADGNGSSSEAREPPGSENRPSGPRTGHASPLGAPFDFRAYGDWGETAEEEGQRQRRRGWDHVGGRVPRGARGGRLGPARAPSLCTR